MVTKECSPKSIGQGVSSIIQFNSIRNVVKKNVGKNVSLKVDHLEFKTSIIQNEYSSKRVIYNSVVRKYNS